MTEKQQKIMGVKLTATMNVKVKVDYNTSINSLNIFKNSVKIGDLPKTKKAEFITIMNKQAKNYNLEKQANKVHVNILNLQKEKKKLQKKINLINKQIAKNKKLLDVIKTRIAINENSIIMKVFKFSQYLLKRKDIPVYEEGEGWENDVVDNIPLDDYQIKQILEEYNVNFYPTSFLNTTDDDWLNRVKSAMKYEGENYNFLEILKKRGHLT